MADRYAAAHQDAGRRLDLEAGRPPQPGSARSTTSGQAGHRRARSRSGAAPGFAPGSGLATHPRWPCSAEVSDADGRGAPRGGRRRRACAPGSWNPDCRRRAAALKARSCSTRRGRESDQLTEASGVLRPTIRRVLGSGGALVCSGRRRRTANQPDEAIAQRALRGPCAPSAGARTGCDGAAALRGCPAPRMRSESTCVLPIVALGVRLRSGDPGRSGAPRPTRRSTGTAAPGRSRS